MCCLCRQPGKKSQCDSFLHSVRVADFAFSAVRIQVVDPLTASSQKVLARVPRTKIARNIEFFAAWTRILGVLRGGVVAAALVVSIISLQVVRIRPSFPIFVKSNGWCRFFPKASHPLFGCCGAGERRAAIRREGPIDGSPLKREKKEILLWLRRNVPKSLLWANSD